MLDVLPCAEDLVTNRYFKTEKQAVEQDEDVALAFIENQTKSIL